LLYTFSTPLVRGSASTKRSTHSSSSATMKNQKRPNEGMRVWGGGVPSSS
jgi:hypothetical protein